MVEKIIRDPLFWMGLLLKILIICSVFPISESKWYLPFLDLNVHSFSLDPWGNFIAHQGDSKSFPYGYIMFFYFFPFIKFASNFHFSLHLFYGLALLFADFGLGVLLKNLFHFEVEKFIKFYWLSPIVIFSSYWLGLNDLIPVFFLYLGLYFLMKNDFLKSGIVIGFSISAKLSMVLAVPFVMIYLIRNKSLQKGIQFFLIGIFLSFLLFGLPFLFSEDGVSMLVQNPEMLKIFNFSVNFGQFDVIYIVPAAYIFILYFSWSIRRQSFEMLNVLMGVSFFTVLLLVPLSFGWMIWLTPLLVLYQCKQGRHAEYLVLLFSILLVVLGFFLSPNADVFVSKQDLFFQDVFERKFLNAKNLSILHTLIFSLGTILLIRIIKEMLLQSHFYQFTRKPFVIGIAGDSGAGKDTLVLALQNIFGKSSTSILSGDDYHNWDRNKPMWQVMTHLNPRANKIEQYHKDLINLTNGKSVYIRHYDHSIGKISRPYKLKTNDFIISSGLHALHLPSLRKCYDLSIYLDIDEDLRKYFKLKRDVFERGYDKQTVLNHMERRELDSLKFIKPQADVADLIISLRPVQPIDLETFNDNKMIKMRLVISSKSGMQQESLFRVLIGICGLHVDIELPSNKNELVMIIEGDVTGDDINLAAKKILLSLNEIIDFCPKWEDGIKGLMQLVVLTFVNQLFNERLVC